MILITEGMKFVKTSLNRLSEPRRHWEPIYLEITMTFTDIHNHILFGADDSGRCREGDVLTD